MAYIPPQKRHSKGPKRPTPVPEMLVPEFNRKINLGSRKHNAGMKVNYVEYADHAVQRWFVCGLDSNSSFPSSVHFEDFPEESVEHKSGAKPLVLVTNNLAKG
ncbi:hypothetical protein AB3S75_022545 [Citrus x aurantiifolia]